MMSTNKRLMALMKGHSLTSQQVADLVQVKLVTVQHWRQTPGNIGHNSMPPGLLELLTIKLEEVKASTNQTGEKR